MQHFYKPLAFLLFLSCQNASTDISTVKPAEDAIQIPDSILKEHLVNGAWKHPLYSREWDEEINKGLAKDSTIAYLWQQKSMPMFKQGKYELGMPYVDKAVKYDRARWQPYRAYIKCIFAKTYQAAITDFGDCKKRFGNTVVMDHSYNFYIALCRLQLNQFALAEELLQKEVSDQAAKHGEEWVHHLDLFYLGICQYEQKKYDKAYVSFERSLKQYPQLSHANYYKSLCLKKLGKEEDAAQLMAVAKKYAKEGYGFTDDGARYERYPYQVRW